ncbi:MAG: SDR family oxidoreductase [Cyanobacteria bacterium]|nr:SDR family oxidoreductase [Cyanobacteriota bacterium]MDA0866026.1 SDR family oxidoreductase [Cyanobacteriota bacterium]
MQVLVAGATGETGRRVVQQLRDRNIPFRALVRDEQAAQAILPAGTEMVVGDVLDPTSLAAAIAGCTALICATGAKPSLDPTGPYQVDYVGTQNLVKAAKAAGIEQFVLVSSLCVSRFFHPLNLFWLVLWWKQQAEKHLAQSGLTYTIVRPGGLKNDDSDGRSLVMAPADTLFEGSVPRLKVAEACVEALLTPSSRNKIVEIVAQAEATAQPYADLFAGVV